MTLLFNILRAKTMLTREDPGQNRSSTPPHVS
jgi:hypothetical protein